MPTMPSLNFQGMANEETAPKRMLSPAFATHKATSSPNVPENATTSRPDASSSVPSSPGILFGSFDQWETAHNRPATADAVKAPVEVDAPEDVRYVTFALMVANAVYTHAPAARVAWWQWKKYNATARHIWWIAPMLSCMISRMASTRCWIPSL